MLQYSDHPSQEPWAKVMVGADTTSYKVNIQDINMWELTNLVIIYWQILLT